MHLFGRFRQSNQSKQFAQTALVTYIGMALSLVSAPILARELGPDGRGVLAGSFALVQILAWTAFLGLPRGMALVTNRSGHTSASGVAVLAVLGPVAGALSFLLAGPMSNGDGRIETGIKAASALLVLTGISALGQELILVQGRLLAFNAVRALNLIVPSVAYIGASLFGSLSLREAYVTTLGCQGAATLLGLVFALPGIRTARRQSAPWGFSIRYWVGSAFDGIGGRIDQLILTALSPASSVGVYAVAVTCSGAAGGLTQALNHTTYARLTSRSSGTVNQGAILKHRTIVGAGLSLIVGSCVVAAVGVAGARLFGVGFQDLTLTTAILVVAQLLNDQWQLRSYYDSARESAHALMWASASAMLVLVATAAVINHLWGLDQVRMACCMVVFATTRLVVREALISRHAAAHAF